MSVCAPPVELATRRQFLIGTATAAGLAALSACGDDDDSGSGDTRSIEGARGPVEVPVAPKRVASLIGSVDVDVIALGITPVFAGEFASGWVDLPDSVVTSDLVPPDPERVAATRPDLLLGWEWLADDTSWNSFTQIAPTVPLSESARWQDTFLTVADAVNRRERGEAELAAFDARAAELKSRMGQRPPVQLAHIAFYESGVFSYYGQDRDTTRIMQQTGLDVVGPDATDHEYSNERLREVTAPWLIVYGSGDGGRAALDEVKKGGLWAGLPAVAANQVIEVDADLWSGAGFLWAKAFVDDLERIFLVG